MSEHASPAHAYRGALLPGPWYRVQAIPVPERTPSAEWDFVAVLPAVLSAAQQHKPFVIGWLSAGRGAPLELITNAGPVVLSDDGQQGLLFPNGARGVLIGDDWLARAGQMVWTHCPGKPAPPLRTEQPESIAIRKDWPLRPTLFESALVTLLSRPFGWLVIADRCADDAVDREIRDLQFEQQRYSRADHLRLEAEGAERRVAELETFGEAGLWNVRVLAGAASQEELGQIAPVLVGSVEMSHHPYRLRSGSRAIGFGEALTAGPQLAGARPGASAFGSPFAVTAGALPALAGLPRREVPGLRVVETGYFDVTAETAKAGDARDRGRDADAAPPPIELGAILDGQDRHVGALTIPRATLNRHVFVTGATGAGKSQTVRHLLEQLTRGGIPWLAIEPVKAEYAKMAGRVEGVAGVTVVNPSDPAAVPLSINPLQPEPGYPVQAHIDMVRALFQAAFDAEEPFPQIMSQALQRVYEASGWDVVTGGGAPGSLVEPSVPTLEQLQHAALQVIDDVGYGAELMADVRGFVDVRLRSLRIGSAGRFFEGGHAADIGGLLRDNVVLAIEDVANDEDKAFLMGTLIIRVVEHLRMRSRQTAPGEPAGGLRHVIVIEEAHRLLRNRGQQRSSAHAVELFAGMLAEIRAYGEGIIVAEQIPTKLVPDVIKNTALKVVHRLPAFDDRHVVGAAMNLDADQSREVVSLPPGVAAVFADGMDRPLRVRIPLGENRERVLAGPPPPIDGRRSAACGCECRSGRACTLYELRQADLLAGAPDWAWLRLWTDTLVLAHVVNRPLPAVPPQLGRGWSRLAPRLRECMLASVLDRSVGRRASALRTAYPPAELTAAIAATAQRLLGEQDVHAGAAPGTKWVIPQVRWLHEMDRLFPHDGTTPDKHAPAPPMDYPLPGVKQQPDAKIGHRVRALRRHPLSMELEANRPIALTAIGGDDEHAAFANDLAVAAIGVDPSRQIAHVAEVMRVESWLELVLDWPSRLVNPFAAGTGARPPFEG
ncbi:MAG TPA: ATP-binding protein [Streptosporangiaceae bacterium]|nr:ATP-binding protein [Streptosporangiaceae bacterium]